MYKLADLYLMGTFNGDIFICKELGPLILVDSPEGKALALNDYDRESGKRDLPNQCRIVSAHSTAVKTFVMMPSSKTLLTVAEGEDAFFQWQVVESKPYFDLDGTFYNMSLLCEIFQEVLTEKQLGFLLKEGQKSRSEIVHFKRKINKSSAMRLRLKKIIGRKSLDRRNNIGLTYDNKIMFNAGSLICMIPLQARKAHHQTVDLCQDFIMKETQMDDTYLCSEIATFVISNDRRSVAIGTLEDPSRIYFWQICAKACYFKL